MLPGRKYTPIDYALMAWRRRWIIVAGLFVGAYAALVVSSFLRDIYESEMLIQVVPQRVPDSFVQSTVTLRTEDRLNALSQQVMSRTALESLIQQMELYPRERARFPMEDVITRMRLDIEVEPVVARNGGGADAFFVRFSYSDRDIATRVTERLGSLFVDLNARDRGQLAQATNEFLESQLTETRRQLEEQEQKLERFRQQNAGRLPSQLDFNMQAIQSTQLSIQALVESLARDRDRKLMLERLYNDAQVEPAVPTPPFAAAQPGKDGGPDALAGQTAAEQLAAARKEFARLQLRLTPEHPDIGRARRVIAELEKRTEEEAAALRAASSSPNGSEPPVLTLEQAARRDRLREMRAQIDSVDRQIKFKEAEEQRQRETLGDFQRRIEETPGVESEWIALTRDYDTQQAAYKDLLSKSEQSRVAVELERRQIGEQFRVLDPARPPVRPKGMRRVQVNGLGALAGLALGLAIAALLELRDRTFHTLQDVQEVLQLPIIAQVPYVMLDADRHRERRLRLAMSSAAALVVAAAGYGVWALELWKYVA
jgi:polysaccharide chain length determinant protein (PEP-CTERM system associated)